MGSELSATFLRALWVEQAEAGISDAQLARDLGCDRAYISRLKGDANRPSNISMEFAVRAGTRFPALRVLLNSFFPDEMSKVDGETTTLNNTTEDEGR